MVQAHIATECLEQTALEWALPKARASDVGTGWDGTKDVWDVFMTLRKDSSVVSCQCILMACSHSRSVRQIP